MGYCGNCGTQFDGNEKKIEEPRVYSHTVAEQAPFEERGRISLLLYLGAGIIAFSGVMYAATINSTVLWGFLPNYSYYAQAIGVIGFAIALVGLARQARRMIE
jgi:hypothetical protein